MLSKSHPIILFIDRFGFSVYQDALANIPKFSFTPDLVANLDVISKDQFVNLIGTFIQVNKMVPSSLAVILSDNVIYVKDLVSPAPKLTSTQGLETDAVDDKEHEDEVQIFLENVPFEEVLAKVIKVCNINRAVAVNKDLAMTIADTFSSKGFSVEAIAPGFMYGQSANFTAGLTPDNARIVLENPEILKSGNLLTDQEKIIPSQNLESEFKNPAVSGVKKPKGLRQFILIGVFVTLLVILAVVYLNLGVSQTPPKSSKAKSAATNAVNTSSVIPTLTQTPVASVPIDPQNIKIKIIQSSQSDEKVTNLKSGLLGMGFTDIISEVSEVSIPEKSSVVFSQNVPADLRNNVIAEIKKILPDISILENQDVDLSVSILIGKS